jgi:hypothetical protein
MEVRNKLKSNQKVQSGQKLKSQPIRETDKMLSAYYDKEFRKWHYKLALIILFCLATIYALVINVSGLLTGV